MLTTVEGFFDGESVKLSEPVTDKKNQRVIVTFVDDAQVVKPKKSLTELFKAVASGKYDGKKSNNVDPKEFIREFHEYINSGQCEADKKAARLGLLDDSVLTALANGECVTKAPIDFDVETFIRESRDYSNSDANEETKATEEPEELITRAGA